MNPRGRCERSLLSAADGARGERPTRSAALSYSPTESKLDARQDQQTEQVLSQRPAAGSSPAGGASQKVGGALFLSAIPSSSLVRSVVPPGRPGRQAGRQAVSACWPWSSSRRSLRSRMKLWSGLSTSSRLLWFYFGYSGYLTLTEENGWSLPEAEKWLLTQCARTLLRRP